MDVTELLQLVQRGVIDTRHITTRYFPLTAVNEALDYIEKRCSRTRSFRRLSIATVSNLESLDIFVS